MNRTDLVNEIMREYDRDRQAASRLKEVRTAEVYKKSPEIEAIDESLKNHGIEISKAILSGQKAAIEQIVKENRRKLAKREKLLKSAGFSNDYLENIYKCLKCRDTGFTEGADRGKCDCFKQKMISKYYQMSNLSKTFTGENFDNFNIKYYSSSKDENSGISPREMMELIYKEAVEFVENFGQKPANLFFYGKVGLGKTFLCNCIAKEILDKGHTVLYAPAARLFKIVEDARFRREEMIAPSEQIDFFYSAELLIIDDLGTEFSTIATQSALFDIVNSRILDGRSTIISSNLSPKDMEDSYSDRFVSRLLEHYGFCRFLGSDIRQAKKYAFKEEA